MHPTGGVVLGCTDCHGGDASVNTPADEGYDADAQHDKRNWSAAYRAAMDKAHVLPRYPEHWKTSANPERSYTWLLKESLEFVRFVNPGDLRVADWLGVKAIGAIVGGVLFAFLFGVVGVLGFPFPIGFLLGIVGALFGYTAPEFWLGGRVKKRQKAILLMIPDALDLLTISVRAGLGFDAALGKVVEKLKGPLSDEFRRALAEVRVGKARRDALRDIVPRTEVGPLTNFIGAIILIVQNLAT
jgi:hypothetical protein